MTIYEVIHEFFDYLFPADILLSYVDIIDLTVFCLTYVVVFGLILIPLWSLATFFIRRSKR